MDFIMVKVTPKPKVLAELKKAFPIPPDGAERILNKYVNALEQLMTHYLLYGKSVVAKRNHSKNVLELPVKKLLEKGGRIVRKNIRVIRTHIWLQQNGVPLIKFVYKGNNIDGLNSLVEMTANAEVKISTYLTYLRGLSRPDLNLFLNLLTQDDIDEIDEIYKKYKKSNFSQFDSSPVNLTSVSNYIKSIVSLRKSKRKPIIKPLFEEQVLHQAIWLLRIGQYRGQLDQPQKPSAFGRMYYQGISVQSIHKSLREAVLGNAWEYDVKSSAINWRLCHLADLKGKDINQVATKFPITMSYLQNKQQFFVAIQSHTFANSHMSSGRQTDLIKTVFTAINFGATLTEHAWKNQWGQIEYGSVRKIFTKSNAYPQEFKVFCGHPDVTQFIAEQRKISSEIKRHYTKKLPHVFNNPILRSCNDPLKTCTGHNLKRSMT